MGLNPIEYRPWNGERSEHGRRPLVIATKVAAQRVRSKWFVGLLVLGAILVHGLSLIFMSIMPHQSLTAEAMASQMQNGLFFIFTIILVAMACSDLVAEDLRSNSLVLYLSRALRADGYLLGKALGAAMSIIIFTLVLPVIVAAAITATQQGSDYLSSLAVIGRTAVAGAWTTLFLVPFGVLISALTSRRTYAAVGTFMVFFVLGLISSFLAQFEDGWLLLSPQSVLSNSYTVIYGLTLPSNTDGVLLAIVSVVFVTLPTLLTYYIIHRKEVGA